MEIELLPHQLEFVTSTAEHTAMVCGRGAGKSYVLGWKTGQLLSEGRSVLVCGSDYRNLKLSIFKSIIDTLNFMGVSYKYNKSDYIIEAMGQVVYGISGEAWEKARGLTMLSVLVIDEAALIPEEAIPVMSACLRGQDKDPLYYYASTPRGKTGKAKWFYELATDPETKTIHAVSRDNYAIREGYHKSMEKIYGKTQFAKQELGGAFVDFKAGVIDSDWLKCNEVELSDKLPTRHIVRSYDLAVTTKTKGDYTATCLMSYDRSENLFTIHDIQRWKEEWPATHNKIVDIAFDDGVRVGIHVESFATQKGLVQDLRKDRVLRGYSVNPIAPRGDKISKVMPIAAQMQQGNVRINKNIKILEDVYAEMDEFDGSDNVHDDMIDAIALAYFALCKQIPSEFFKKIKGLY